MNRKQGFRMEKLNATINGKYFFYYFFLKLTVLTQHFIFTDSNWEYLSGCVCV